MTADSKAPAIGLGSEEVSRPESLVGEGNATFADFYRANVPFVWRNACRLVGGDGAADDIVQEVFLVALRRASEFQGRSSARTWLFGILRHVVQHHHRASKRHPGNGEVDLDAIAEPTSLGPHAALERAQAIDTVYDLLAQLDAPRREVFILAELEQMTAPEIADAIDAPQTTVYARLRDARRQFEAAAQRYRARSGRRTP